MPGLIGKKVGMTSIYGASGKNIPCTVIEVGPCVVTQVRTLEKDGYAAVKLSSLIQISRCRRTFVSRSLIYSHPRLKDSMTVTDLPRIL